MPHRLSGICTDLSLTLSINQAEGGYHSRSCADGFGVPMRTESSPDVETLAV